MTTTTTDVRDRRAASSNMETACQKLANCVADLHAFPGDAGIALLVADRIARITADLVMFRARDLISMRHVEVQS